MENKRNFNYKKGMETKITNFVSKQEGSYGFGRKRKKKKRKEEEQSKGMEVKSFCMEF